MSELVWTCQNGAVFSSRANGIRIEVARASRGNGFRYQLVGQCSTTAHEVSLASGHRDVLRDALEAAERTARNFGHSAGGQNGAPAPRP